MIRPLPLNLVTILVWQLVLISLCAGDKYTAPIDYGFGPLTILVDADGGTLTRCQDVKITLGGGFAPYKLGEDNLNYIRIQRILVIDDLVEH